MRDQESRSAIDGRVYTGKVQKSMPALSLSTLNYKNDSSRKCGIRNPARSEHNIGRRVIHVGNVAIRDQFNLSLRN